MSQKPPCTLRDRHSQDPLHVAVKVRSLSEREERIETPGLRVLLQIVVRVQDIDELAEIKACVCEMEAFAYSVGFGALGDLATGLGVVGTFTDNSRLGNFATVLGYLTNIASSMIPS